jgi:hypothetical protein
MLELSHDQRRLLIDTLADAANVAAGGLVFGQFLSQRSFSVVLAAAGAGTWVVMLAWSLFLARRRQL